VGVGRRLAARLLPGQRERGGSEAQGNDVIRVLASAGGFGEVASTGLLQPVLAAAPVTVAAVGGIAPHDPLRVCGF
jgi:hypothetical protein